MKISGMDSPRDDRRTSEGVKDAMRIPVSVFEEQPMKNRRTTQQYMYGHAQEHSITHSLELVKRI